MTLFLTSQNLSALTPLQGEQPLSGLLLPYMGRRLTVGFGRVAAYYHWHLADIQQQIAYFCPATKCQDKQQ